MTPLLRRIAVTGGIAIVIAIAAIALLQALAADQPPPLAAPVGAAGAAPAAATTTTVADDDIAVGLDAILAADTTAAKGDRAAARGQLRRLAAWGRLVHATVVVDLKAGGLTTIQLDHGTISAVSATSLTMQEAGGGSVTVQLSDETRIRRAGAKAAIAALKVGDEVFAMSKVETSGTGAYLVVVPRG
jgi:hypothetical protein